MDNFFWTTLVADAVHAILAVGLGTLAGWALISYYLRMKKRFGAGTSQAGDEAGTQARITLPLRLQAYERIVLYLERIQPVNLVLRVQKGEMNAQELQAALIRTVREEFDYNLSQQVYVSSTAWTMVRNAMEEMVSVVNRASSQVAPQDPATQFARVLFDLDLEKENQAARAALNFLKDEARPLMK